MVLTRCSGTVWAPRLTQNIFDIPTCHDMGVCRLAPLLFLNQDAQTCRGNIFDIFVKKHVFWPKKAPAGIRHGPNKNISLFRPFRQKNMIFQSKKAPAGIRHAPNKNIIS